MAMGERGSWKVRPASVPDAAAVRDTASAAWRDAYAGLLRAETIEAFIEQAYSIETLERRISGDDFFVIAAGGRVIAFADAVQRADRVTLAAIYARPEMRSRGAGTLLLAAVRSRHLHLPISADVLVGNRSGEVFYERRGFTPGELLEDVLFGEPVVERRWWLPP